MSNDSEQQSGSSSLAKNNSSKGLLGALIVCGLLMIGGVCFGTFGMMQANKLGTENNELRNKVSELEKKEYHEDGYFYLEEWGIKVKLAEGNNYKVLGYMYDDYAKNPASSQGSYGIWGGRYEPENSDYYPSYYLNSHESEPAVYIMKYLSEFVTEDIEQHSTKVFEKDGFSYFASITNAASTDDDKLINAIKDFGLNSGFLKPENYSAIK